MRQSLSQRQLQKLSPRQIQLMKLIQIPTATLDQRIQEELEANPALDEARNEISSEQESEEAEVTEEGVEEFEMDDYLQEYIDDDPATYKMKSNNYSSDDDDSTGYVSVVEKSLHEYLSDQLGMFGGLSEEQWIVGDQIVGSIDEDGYLRRDVRALMDDLMLNRNVYVHREDVEKMIMLVQQLDPPGIGARNLQECLSIQIKKKLNRRKNLENIDMWLLADELIAQHFEQFSKKHYKKLKKSMNLSGEQLQEVIDLILTLNPKPATGHNSQKNIKPNYIVPDFYLRTQDGEMILEVNGNNIPELKISDQYKEMLINYSQHKLANSKLSKKDKEAVMFIKQKIDSAKWFIDAIQQRRNTMYSTMYTILQYQKEFFSTGDMSKLKPMILKDVAEVTGLDISTISRVANSKYIQTEFGTFHLKDFFSESIEKTNGEVVSTNKVKAFLTDLIKSENKAKPLSDECIKALLYDEGYDIARRTVAKYREQLGIPVARLRKEIVV